MLYGSIFLANNWVLFKQCSHLKSNKSLWTLVKKSNYNELNPKLLFQTSPSSWKILLHQYFFVFFKLNIMYLNVNSICKGKTQKSCYPIVFFSKMLIVYLLEQWSHITSNKRFCTSAPDILLTKSEQFTTGEGLEEKPDDVVLVLNDPQKTLAVLDV